MIRRLIERTDFANYSGRESGLETMRSHGGHGGVSQGVRLIGIGKGHPVKITALILAAVRCPAVDAIDPRGS